MSPWFKLTLASRITICRMMGIPVFILLLTYYLQSLKAGQPNEVLRVWALTVFLGVALTDALDGYIARARNQITRLGRILDPLADKMLLLSAVIMLTRPSIPALEPQLPIWYTLIIISRDAFLIAGAFVIDHLVGHVEIHPRLTGKLSTVFQMTCIVWVLAAWPVAPFKWIVWSGGAITVFAWILYFIDGFRQLEHSEASQLET
ncbi:MAG: CDP-alcohol phosphatidyltransferase family protein [Verrucomicrobia bacterium]|nr:CDP-alcohol phosphatidyltransferase family protein [Verrucomicrobiota bacterium]